jgi:serine/threonine-protein kinase
VQGKILSNRYVITDELGIGGMGCVYHAVDLRTGGEVAVKVPHTFLARNPQFIERLRREAQIAASLYSPRVVRVVDLDTHEGLPYLVMEYVPGETLADLLKARGRLTIEESLSIALEVARALEAAHAKGIVHRDLKPQNIKLVDGEVKVLDFGIAKAEGFANVTQASVFMGTPEYAAPESVEGIGDIRSDIYSLGVMLYQMLVGELPFTGPTPIAVLQQHRTAAPPVLAPDLPDWARRIIGRCLAKRPEDRYQSPRELVQALRDVLDAPSSGKTLPAAPPAVTPTVRRAGDDDGRPVAATVAAPPPPPITSGDSSGDAVAALPAPPTPASRPARRRMWTLALVPVVALALGAAALAVALVNGGGGGAQTPTATPDERTAVVTVPSTPPSPTGSGGTPAPSPTASPRGAPTPTPPPPLVAAGQQRSLADVPPISFDIGEDKCPNVKIVWRLQSIAAEASGRVAIAYTVQVPRVNGVPDCRVNINPDKDCKCWALQTRLVSDRVKEALISGGRGSADTGADDIYGRDPIPGTWLFDGVDLAGTELTLLHLVDGMLYHRQPLLRQ